MRGILISVALHTLVLLAAALGVPWLAKPPANAARNFEVDIVRLSDITQAGKGGKPKPRTERKPDAERETTRKPVARDRRAGKPPETPEPVKPESAKPDLPRTAAPKPKPKPAEIEPPKVAKPKAQPKPKPPEKTAAAKPKAPPKPEPPKTTASAKPEAAPPTPPKPAKKAEPAPKPKAAPPKRVEIDPRALQRQASKPKKRAGVKKPEPPASKPAPKPVAKPKKKPKKKPETRMARPAPKPEKKTVPPRKPAPPLAKPKKKPEPGPKETAKKAEPKKPAKPEVKAAKPKKKPEPEPPETAKKAEPKVERHVAALPRARPRPPAQPRPEKSAKQPPKAVKKPPARKDPLDSVFKTVGKLKKSQQSDRDRTAARTPAGVKTAARSLRLTLSEIQAVRRQIQPCWNFPAGAQNAGALRVRITIWLNRDGSVRDAKILDGADFSGNAKLRAAADAGIRAVRNPRCSPLKLPPEKFDQWKVLTIDFDPSKLSSE